MNKTYKIESYLPLFPGFYNTGFDIFEYMDEEDDEKLNNGEFEIDYKTFNEDAIIALTGIVREILEDNKIDLKIIPEKIISPKYYNYSNDSANVCYEVDDNNMQKIFGILNDNYDLFNDYIKGKYTSCDGFISRYSSNVDDWLMFDNVINNSHMFGSILEFLFIDVFSFNVDDMMIWFHDDIGWYGEYLVDVDNK